MSVAGLRYEHDQQWTGPLETKSGSHIYHVDPQGYHDWKFRTCLRIHLYEEGHRTLGPKQEDPSPTCWAKASEKTDKKDRSVLVNRVLERLRGGAFGIARDLGLDA